MIYSVYVFNNLTYDLIINKKIKNCCDYLKLLLSLLKKFKNKNNISLYLYINKRYIGNINFPIYNIYDIFINICSNICIYLEYNR